MRENGGSVFAWWDTMVLPMRRAWRFVAGRVTARRRAGLALMKLHKDVEMCGYEDVLVMWEILRLEMQHPPPSTRQRRQSFWRPILWSDTTTPLSNSSMFPTRNM